MILHNQHIFTINGIYHQFLLKEVQSVNAKQKTPLTFKLIHSRRDGWQIFSSVQLWEQLVSHTKKSSRDHAALSDIYTCHIVQRCNQINEDLQRIYKKVFK